MNPHPFENPQCICNKGEQTVDHIIYSCDLHEKERDKLVAVITRTEQWPISKSKMMLKYYKDFKQFTDSVLAVVHKTNIDALVQL